MGHTRSGASGAGAAQVSAGDGATESTTGIGAAKPTAGEDATYSITGSGAVPQCVVGCGPPSERRRGETYLALWFVADATAHRMANGSWRHQDLRRLSRLRRAEHACSCSTPCAAISKDGFPLEFGTKGYQMRRPLSQTPTS